MVENNQSDGAAASSDDDVVELVLTDALERLGRYHLVERIGVGGMAEVYLAEQEGIAGVTKTVVVKRILSHLASDRHYVDMFLREARLAARLQHPNIVQVLDFAEDDGNYFLAMEHVHGMTLDRLAATAWRNKRSLPMELVCSTMAEAALGLHHAHTRPEGSLIHRDVTPENLMINSEGVAKVLDFGIAKPLDDKTRSMTSAGELKGKLRFLSPEQVMGLPVDARTDVFALGVTMYWLLTGVPPVDGASDLEVMEAVVHKEPVAARSINPTIPGELDRLVMRMIAKEKRERFDDADAVHDALSFAGAARRKVIIPFVEEMMRAAPVTAKAPRDLRDLPGALPMSELMSSWGAWQPSESFVMARPTSPPPAWSPTATVSTTAPTMGDSFDTVPKTDARPAFAVDDDGATLDDQMLPASALLAAKKSELSGESVFTTRPPLEKTVATRKPGKPATPAAAKAAKATKAPALAATAAGSSARAAPDTVVERVAGIDDDDPDSDLPTDPRGTKPTPPRR